MHKGQLMERTRSGVSSLPFCRFGVGRGVWGRAGQPRVGQGPIVGVRCHSPLIGVELLLIGDDGPDVADEESRGPEGMADIPGELLNTARAGAWALFHASVVRIGLCGTSIPL